MKNQKRALSVFALVMINVIAVDNLRTLPISAKIGLPLVSYYLIAALTYFVPVALVAAELASTFPKAGGIYVWVREAFGKRSAFITIWLQWIYNVVWYPTILIFIAETFTYLFNPELATNKTYLVSMVVGLFWVFTLLNCFGMKISGMISIIGATVGTILPMLGVIALGILWYLNGHPLAIDFKGSLLPDFSSFGNLAIFSAILFGLLGVEMSAIHAEDVKNPQRDYPRALFYSVVIIITTLVFGSLAIVAVVPAQKLNLVSGFIDAYAIFFKKYNMPWMLDITVWLVIIGGLSGVSAWIIGPSRGLLISAHDKCLPHHFTRVNKHGAPVFILVLQAIIVTILSSLLLLVNSVSSAYWMLTELCAQLALLVYVFLFAAGIKLRYSHPDTPRAYKIPGGKFGIWFVAGMGFLCCLVTIIIGFVPPSQINMENVIFFEGFLISGLILFVVVPWLLAKRFVK
ncbi:MAG: transporter [Legionellales bacterium RIFCSPHIGHO2_12_FULL_35_11]|nr:MAG: transporter [Legionellales bacterium RIFCSPHIGHO2_12_FULL_35_11]